MDTLSPEQRRRTMAAVKGRNTTPELIVRRLLHKAGFRFRLYRNDLPGKPDVALSKYRTVIFVHGCFWHQHPGCKKASKPSTRQDYWLPKLARNIERDKRQISDLDALGWSVLVVWECETKDKAALSEKLVRILSQQAREIGQRIEDRPRFIGASNGQSDTL
ncbi:MAG: DNA mismatch endonuclease Vsr [Candidatus Accumulibacter similis]|nr:MAG: DNA mismatch endonuclease Vsr [Candidatus Accumulibacter similis]